jgi:hypothetical protein
MMRVKTLQCGVLLACSVVTLADPPAATAEKEDKDKPGLSGAWMLKRGETKIEFFDKNVLKISPHGDNDVIVVICEYTAAKEGLVKAKITDFEGKDEVKRMVKEMLPMGSAFTFRWQAKDGTARLGDLKGKEVELLKSHLEGEYSRKK